MRTVILLIFFFFSISASAQNGIIEGLVKDKMNNAPLNGVTVNVQSTGKTDLSDPFGKFLIRDVEPGSYELVISSIGYKTEVIPVEVQQNNIAKVLVNMNLAALNLSEITIMGKRTNNLNTIGAIDIKLRPVNTSQDILRIVPGLFIAQHAGGGKADQLFLRGYDIDHGTDVSETVDGMPVNMVSHAHGQGYADLHFLIPELVEKVDFDKGPYNTTKGNFATAGWVDFKTRDFLRSNTIKVEAGMYDYKRAVGLFKLFDKQNNEQHQQLYVGSEYFLTDSYFDAPQDFHRLNVFARYTALLKNNAQLFITASAFDSKWDASGQIPERAVQSGAISRFGAIDNSEGGNTSRTNINAKFSKLWKSGWKTTDQVYYSNYHFNLYSNFTFFLNDPLNGDGIQQKENRNLFGYTGTTGKNYFIGNKKALTDIGYGFRYDDVRDIQLNRVVKRQFIETTALGDVRELNGFAYINQNLELSNKFELNAGLRFDRFRFDYKNRFVGDDDYRRQTKSTFSPKLNLTYTVSKTVKISLNNAIGFHSNDARVILDNSAKDILPKVYGTDLSFLIKPTKELLLKTTLWHLYSEQEFVYVGDAGIIEPSGRSRRIGIDFSGRYQPVNWLYFDIDINAAKPRAIDEDKGNDYIPLAPTFTSIGGVTIKSKNGFSSTLRYRQMSDRAANEDNTVKAKGYFVADAIANYGFKKFDLSLTLENLFDAKWREAQFDTESRLANEPSSVSEIHYTPGTPRFLKLGLAFNF